MAMAESVIQDIMKPIQTKDGGYKISRDKFNYMKMTVAGQKFDNIQEMSLFGVSKKAEADWNRLVDDMFALMEDLEAEAIRIARIK